MPIATAQKYLDEAELFLENGLCKEAIDACKKAIEADPLSVSAYYNLALIYHRTQHFDNAITSLKKVIELDPGDASAFNNLGVLYFTINVFDEAKKYFEKSLSIEPDYKEAKNNLEKVQQELKKSASRPLSQQVIESHHHKFGFVSLWYERGQAYVTRAIQSALDNQYNTFIFARNGGTSDNPLLQTTGEWNVPNLTVYPEYRIPCEVLKNWVVQNDLKVVFFNEEYDLGLVEVVKQCGVKTVGYYVWELFDPQYVTGCKSLYDKIICPTKACYEKFKNLGMDNVEYIPWGVDLKIFKPTARTENKRVRFFHPAGWGGLHARRGTQFVIDAFQKLNDPNAELLIHTQHGSGIQESNNIKILYGTVPREEIIRMYQESDVAVLPSKWEGLGLTFLESIGCGLPIITVDAQPMNEFVHHGETGFLCRVAERKSYEGIFVDGVHVDIDDMAEKMKMMLNASLRSTMHENVKTFAPDFSITKFKENIGNLFFDVVNRAGENLRLNLGCGTDIKQGYINIDQRWIKGVNQVADVSHLPYKDESVTEVLANDVIEHFPRERTEMVLKEWIRVLRPEGILKIQCPDVRTLAYGLVYNQIPTHEFSRRIYGGQEYNGNFHYAGFDIPEMKRILRKLGMWPQQISTYNGNLAVTVGRKPLLNLKKLRVTLIGSRLSNYPWGTENFIHKALSEFGHEIIDIDFRRDQNSVEKILKIPTDIVIAYKASGINPRLLETMNCPTVLWYPDDVIAVQHAQDDVRNAGYAYDHVYYVNRVGLEKLRQMGITHSSFLPPATDPTIYKYIPGTEKKHDIVFVGNIYPNRRALLDRLKSKFNVLETKAFMEDMVRIFNEAKIVLNLGVSNTGYNLRVFEALGCRSFLVTNEINREDLLFEDGKHLVYFNERNIEDLISHYLKHDDEREAIAENGYREVCAKHTFKHRVTQMLADAGFISISHDEKREAITQRGVHEVAEKNAFERRGQQISQNASTPAGTLSVLACPTFAQRPKRIFCAFPGYNAERINFIMPLQRMGYNVNWYDWAKDFNVYSPTWEETGKPRMNQMILDKLMKEHRESPVDLFFSYLSARTTYHEIIKEIRSMGIPTLNFCCDDTLPVHRQMALNLAPAFDFWWTDNRLTVPEYRAAGAHPIHAYLGANEEFFCYIKAEKKFDLSFIGSAHSYRPRILKAISDTGINVAAFGSGFSNNRVTLEEMVRIFSSCHINLGFAGIGARELGQGHKTLKGRDFEVPMCGGFYMTEYTDEIKNIYEVGKEIVCYHTLDELLETVRYFLAHPDEMEQIRQAGRERALRDHTMSRRFEQVFREMNIW